MCGICGFHNLKERGEAPAILEQMAQSLAHRGPDGTGVWLSANEATGLANTRLAIIDINGGNQPIHSADGRFTIVYNGELYNFGELNMELQARGNQLCTRSDTETVLAAYREWGTDCLQRFRGMFAFAIYDSKTQELFVARDRTGIKPFYYYSGPGGFFFGSELKAILRSRHVPRRLNYEALCDLLVLAFPLLPKTFFAGIRELEPGTWLKMAPSGMTAGRYWSWTRVATQWNEAEALEESEKAIINSLREHLVSDVPVGAFLSGGIDSSLLTALLVKVLDKIPEVFTVAFTESAYDESPFAHIVSSHLGVPHTEIVLDPAKSDVGLVNDILLQFDQPFGDSSAIPTNLICREIRKSVKVAIGGDGGDEMFGGYERFWYADVAQRLGRLPFQWCKRSWQMLQPFRAVAPEMYRKSERLFHAAEAKNGQRLLDLSCYIRLDRLAGVLAPGALAQVGPYVPSLVNGQKDDLGGAEFADSTIDSVLPADYLRKIDVMSGAHGLEVRVPFLGEHVLSCSARIPHRLKYSGRRNKLILRKIAAKYLPSSIVDKPKQGFGIPLDTWLGKKGREEICGLLSSASARILPLVRRDYLISLLSDFANRTRHPAQRSRFVTYQQVYCLWSLELWLNQWNPAL